MLHIHPLLGNDRETHNETQDDAGQRPANYNRGMDFFRRSKRLPREETTEELLETLLSARFAQRLYTED
jgi:hypothetical protein